MDRHSLSPPNRLTALFNIHPGEGRLVALLVSLYFFLGIALLALPVHQAAAGAGAVRRP